MRGQLEKNGETEEDHEGGSLELSTDVAKGR